MSEQFAHFLYPLFFLLVNLILSFYLFLPGKSDPLWIIDTYVEAGVSNALILERLSLEYEIGSVLIGIHLQTCKNQISTSIPYF